MSNEKLQKLVVDKTKAQEEKVFTVIPELKFTEAQLQDPTPMTFTMQQLFDIFVEADDTLVEAV